MIGVGISRNERYTERLSADQKVELVRLFLPYWRGDTKHSVALMIAKAFYWNNTSLQDALSVVKVICELTDDEKVDDWLGVVKEAYQNKDKRGKPYEMRLQGIGFYEHEFDRLVMNLLNIIRGMVFAGNGSIYVRKSSRRFIKIDFESMTTYDILFNQRSQEITYTEIMSAVPHKVVVLQSENKELVKITFRSRGERLIHFEGYIGEISKRLSRALLMVSKRKIADILSLIMMGMIKLGLCEVKKLNN